MASINTTDRDFQAKVAFIQYMTEHPDERLFQSIRNFTHQGFIYASDELISHEGLRDTFYWEGKVAEEEESK